MNGTQGFQGCPGQRGVKVTTLMLTLSSSLFSLIIIHLFTDEYNDVTHFFFSLGLSWILRRKGESLSFFQTKKANQE